MDADERFRGAERFIQELYVPYGLGDVIEDNDFSLEGPIDVV